MAKKRRPFDFLRGLFGGKTKEPDIQTIQPPPYTGYEFPSPDQFGAGPSQVRPLSEQYARQILERSRGEGLVGFEPGRREILRKEFLQDLQDQETEDLRRLSARSSAQGLRGGIPVSIAEQASRGFQGARASGLADIDIADLAARREDINRATYSQPGFVQLGAGLAGEKSTFDFNRYLNQQPTYLLDEPEGPSNLIPSIFGTLGTIAGSYFGGPAGSVAVGRLGRTLGDVFSKRLRRRRTPY